MHAGLKTPRMQTDFENSPDEPGNAHRTEKRPEPSISRILFPARFAPVREAAIPLEEPVARILLRPTRELGRAALSRSPIWSCTGWGLPSFPGHPGNWCALTAPFHPYPARSGAVCFLLHFPSRRRDSTLWSTLPFGVRTFLRIVTDPAAARPAPAVLIVGFATFPVYHSLAVGAIDDVVFLLQLVVHLGGDIHVAA